jgi:hypothetical protein
MVLALVWLVSLVLLVLALRWLRIANTRQGRAHSSDEEFGAEFCSFIAWIFFAAMSAVVFMGSNDRYYDQVSDQEQLQLLDENQKIYQLRANDLIDQFKQYLAVDYPELERTIFDKIGPKELDAYLVQYPQLRSSETITKLVNEIREAADSVYQLQYASAAVKKELRARARSIKFFNFFLPDPPVAVQRLLTVTDPTSVQ